MKNEKILKTGTIKKLVNHKFGGHFKGKKRRERQQENWQIWANGWPNKYFKEKDVEGTNKDGKL